MTTLVKFATLPRYPDICPSKRLIAVLERDGLIEPLVIRDGEIIPEHQERFETFCRIAESYGTEGTDSIIAVYWDQLDANEQQDV